GGGGKQREIDQANNIARVLAANPQAKMLIHCGFDHVIEGTPNNRSWEKAMAGRLKDLTGIDPLTIDQVTYSERGHIQNEHPFARMTGQAGPMIAIMNDGKPLSKNREQFDISVIHPASGDYEGRPKWM